MRIERGGVCQEKNATACCIGLNGICAAAKKRLPIKLIIDMIDAKILKK
jgi:hypothetical protein